MGSLFVCLGLFRGEWLYLFWAASICNLVCLSSESLAWGKQWHAPHVLEDHCVNGPRSVCSEWRSLNTDTSCWTHQHELSEISERQHEYNRSKSELYQGKQWIRTLEWITIRKTMIWWWKCWFIGYVYYIGLLHYSYSFPPFSTASLILCVCLCVCESVYTLILWFMFGRTKYVYILVH